MKKSELYRLINEVIAEVSNTHAVLTLDDSKTERTEDELIQLATQFGLTFGKGSSPDTLSSEAGHPSYYKMTLAGTKEQVEKFLEAAGPGIEVTGGNMFEMTGTGAVAGYQTPMAFSGKGDGERKKKLAARSMPGGKVVGEEVTDSVDVAGGVVAEGRFANFKSSNIMKNHAKVSYGIREAKKILHEVEFLVSICERLKLETGVDQSQLWKRSKQDIKEVHSRLKNIARKIERIGK
jgi:hypothetical protein